jgi:hypothetical protein
VLSRTTPQRVVIVEHDPLPELTHAYSAEADPRQHADGMTLNLPAGGVNFHADSVLTGMCEVEGRIGSHAMTVNEPDALRGGGVAPSASLGGELALAMGLRHSDALGSILCASPGGGFTPASGVLPGTPPARRSLIVRARLVDASTPMVRTGTR